VALTAVLLSLPSFAFGGGFGKSTRLKTRGSKVKFDVGRTATQQPAVFRGVVRDRDGHALPGVTIVVRSEESKHQITASTDADGIFSFASLIDGLYRVEMTLEGFKTATMEHLSLNASEVTHATVTLTTFTQDFINKLPL
jgi:hypothetical protein